MATIPKEVAETELSAQLARAGYARCAQGKVRDIYDLGQMLLLVTTDRLSAFDWVLPTLIPDKGRVLNLLSTFWFNFLNVPNHFMSASPKLLDLPETVDQGLLAGRMMLVLKTQVVPIECVVRGYLSGSGWKEYQRDGKVCGLQLPAGLRESDQLPEPIFTPSTKAHTGHDENISFERMAAMLGDQNLAEELRQRSLDIYTRAAGYARRHGIILADTKFEWGHHAGKLILIDEVLTPDSSRFWPANDYQPGRSQPSFDKQFARDYLEETGWEKNSPPPPLPAHVVTKTRAKYIEAYERLTRRPLP